MFKGEMFSGAIHDFLIDRETARQTVSVWVIYRDPTEFPGSPFAIRRWVMGWPYTSMDQTQNVTALESLFRARTVIGMASNQKAERFKREPTDHDAIVEVWVGEAVGPGGVA